MKNIILLIAVMVLSACASVPTVKSVLGTYERIEDGDTQRYVLLEKLKALEQNSFPKEFLVGITKNLFMEKHIYLENSNVPSQYLEIILLIF